MRSSGRKIAVVVVAASCAVSALLLYLPDKPAAMSSRTDGAPAARTRSAADFEARDRKLSVDARVADLSREVARLNGKLARETSDRRRLEARLDALTAQLSAAAPANQTQQEAS